MDNNALVKQILAIQQDPNLTEGEKARKRQQLMSSRWTTNITQEEDSEDEDGEELLALSDAAIFWSIWVAQRV